MSYENETDFDQSDWNARLALATTNDDFVSLLKALPSEKPMTDDEAIERFKGESTWEHIDSATDMLRWCLFWLMAEWCLPEAQQARCTERLMRESGYSLMTIQSISKYSGARDRWQRSMIELVRQEAIG